MTIGMFEYQDSVSVLGRFRVQGTNNAMSLDIDLSNVHSSFIDLGDAN
jgi:hypothetical protein